MDGEEWFTKAIYNNWISVFTFNKEFTYQIHGVTACVAPHLPLKFINTVIQTELSIQDVDKTIVDCIKV